MSAPDPDVRRGFSHLSRAWYGRDTLARRGGYVDEVTFGLYHERGGTRGEMSMRWVVIDREAVPILRAYDDAWAALAGFSDVIGYLATRDDDNMTPAEFCEALLALGFRDRTETEMPRGAADAEPVPSPAEMLADIVAALDGDDRLGARTLDRARKSLALARGEDGSA